MTVVQTLSENDDNYAVRTAKERMEDDGPTLSLEPSEWVEVMEVTDLPLKLTTGVDPYYLQMDGETITVYRAQLAPTEHDTDDEYITTLIEHYDPYVVTEEDLPR